MADVLSVAAFEVGDPVGVLVLVKADDFALGHGGNVPRKDPEYLTLGSGFSRVRQKWKRTPAEKRRSSRRMRELSSSRPTHLGL
jgi:hypothetical protein